MQKQTRELWDDLSTTMTILHHKEKGPHLSSYFIPETPIEADIALESRR
jgi:hypothetical protein